MPKQIKNKRVPRNTLGNCQDLTGQTFNLLTAVKFSHKNEQSRPYWKCSCKCGNKELITVSAHNLRMGAVKSCGCLNRHNKRGGTRRSSHLNLEGLTFGYSKVLSFHDVKNKKSRWKCLCEYKNCGNIFIATGTALKSGSTKSCGCYRSRKLSWGESGFNRLFSNYKSKSKRLKINFELEKEDFLKIVISNCFYCGCEPYQEYPSQKDGSYGSFIYNGIDRIDSSKGYTLDNSVPCCGFCNVAKNKNNQGFFLDKVKMIYENLKLENY